MVPINFWRNSDLFKKKNIFLAQKLTILELFKENLWKFSKKISQTQNKNLWNLFGATLMILSIKLNNFGSILLWNDLFGLKCHIPMFQSPVCPPPSSQASAALAFYQRPPTHWALKHWYVTLLPKLVILDANGPKIIQFDTQNHHSGPRNVSKIYLLDLRDFPWKFWEISFEML